ncbi:MFS transporter, MHS family, alpha-ketoglutarate permease [Chitinophaga costaii]|uniref:MFS transporter, MHS family, alpha-ketoglutarate permease n=1 Tax=Chitinophaga costaii TaxID=1335309 RepID=A0A1C4AHD2_9BACT|nr:MFS transporter [Chitinophaga costaii]PUZ26603.1 MFS transporter [Chitinophaga costaii]SCB93988.1 MFS transporter, MHS family, alpha-ketoglutarate permease [Chitinophaga costaii]
MSATASASSVRHPLLAILTGAVGNLVEWYDWYIYAAFSLYFAPAFFPKLSATAQLLNTAAIFAVGFLMRPIGGWLFGAIADRRGRKASMTISVLLISFGSLVIAFTPGYDQIGVLAPLLLFLARLLQGLSVGGEYGTVATYLSEIASPQRRGFFSSFQYVTLIGGQLCALGVQLFLQKVWLSPAQLAAWGWRIPFVIGALLALVAFIIRRHMEESMHLAPASPAPRSSLLLLCKLHPRAVITVVGLTMGGTLAFYTFTTYMQKFLVNTLHFTIDRSTVLTFWLMLLYAVMHPLFGWLSDQVGRKPLLIIFGVLGTLTTVPILTALSHTHSEASAFWLILAALTIVSCYTSVCGIVKAEMFPANVRALGVGFPYAIAVAVFGGSAESIALYVKKIGHESWFYWYVTLAIFISLIVYVCVKDSKQHSYIDKD